ncbi:MAG: GTPase [Candidatus Micrarchaeota archaeon]
MSNPNFKLRTWAQVKGLLRKCQILVEVVDARNISNTRIKRLESSFKGKLVIAATKADLLPKIANKEKTEDIPIIYCSSRTREGIKELKHFITSLARKKLKSHSPPINILIFGIPNVGKSSIINSIIGRKITKTGFRAGITRGIQWIKFNDNILFIDAPGIADFAMKDEALALHSALDVEKLQNPQKTAEKLIHKFLSAKDDSLFSHYKIEKCKNTEEILAKIAIKRGKLLKRGEPNILEASKILIRDWQKGKIILTKCQRSPLPRFC